MLTGPLAFPDKLEDWDDPPEPQERQTKLHESANARLATPMNLFMVFSSISGQIGRESRERSRRAQFLGRMRNL